MYFNHDQDGRGGRVRGLVGWNVDAKTEDGYCDDKYRKGIHTIVLH
jgi:hypothetical protein